MEKENARPLDTSLVEEAYQHQLLPPHEKLGQGVSLTFGTTRAEIYSQPPDLPPVVRLRLQIGSLALVVHPPN